MSDTEQEIQRLDEGEAWGAIGEVVELEVKWPLDKVIPVWLPSAEGGDHGHTGTHQR